MPYTCRRRFLAARMPKPMRRFACAALVAVCACAGYQPKTTASPHVARRIVSLVPSLTEDLCALGAGRQIVGVSSFSGDIACAKGLPRVGNAAGIDAERIVSVRPDLVVGIPSQRAMTAPLRRAGIPTMLIADDSYADIFRDISALAAASGHSGEGRSLSSTLQRRTRALRAGERSGRNPRVIFVAQAMPLWIAGPQSYIGSLVRLAGARLVPSQFPALYGQYNGEALLQLDPDAVIATGDAHVDAVLSREPWRSLRAVRERHVFILRDAALLVRPGPRYNQGLSWIIARLRPLTSLLWK